MSLVDYQSSDEDSDEDTKYESKIDVPEPSESSSKPKQPVRIALPSLVKYEEDEDEAVSASKKIKLQTSSGLLSMLPPPKFSGGKSTHLVPHVLTKKPAEIKKCESTPRPTAPSIPVVRPALQAVRETIDKVKEDKNDGLSNDFFSLDRSNDPPIFVNVSSIPLPESRSSKMPISMHSDTELFSSVHSQHASTSFADNTNVAEPKEKPFTVSNLIEPNVSDDEPSAQSEPLVQSSSSFENDDIMSDERFLKLQGRKSRRIEDLNIIDISGDSLLSDKKDWHIKSITQEKSMSHSRKKNDMPTHTQKRKHQITYLAFQAKEREIDLKNQWAENRLTKQQTQSKYGF